MQKLAGSITGGLIAVLVVFLLVTSLADFNRFQFARTEGPASSRPVVIRAVSTGVRSYQSACDATSSPRPITIAVVVRTHPGHAAALPVMLGTLGLACQNAGGRAALHIMLTNTDPKRYKDLEFMYKAVHAGASHLKDCPCSSIEVVQFRDAPWENVFGYDYTQYVLEGLLYGCRLAADGSCLPANVSTSSLGGNSTQGSMQKQLPLAYLLFTNGDNLFNVGLLKSCLPHMEHQVDVVAFSFTSHHLRDKVPNRAVGTAFQLGYIDLSSAFNRRERLLAVGKEVANSVPQGRMFERDFFFADGIIKSTANGTTSKVTMPQVLLFHQR